MFSTTLWLLCRSAVFAFAIGACLLQASPVLAQGIGAGSGTNREHDTRRQPYPIQLSGFLDASQPDEQSLAVVTIGFSIYRETRQFEIVTLEAPDYPQFSPQTVLQQTKRHKVNFRLVGPKELLSKIAQSPPDTPLKIVGMFTPRKRDLQLISVEELGYEGKY